MRFYVITLSLYSIAVTILAGMLMMQNRELKTSSGPKVDYAKIYEIDIQDIPMIGTANAPITIVEFSDFECGFCASASDSVRKLLEAYPGKLRVGYKNMPLSFHKNARGAAAAALAAYRQGKFWEMEQKLFENQMKLGEPFYLAAATELGLDMVAFKKEMAVEVWEDYLTVQGEEAAKAQVTGTPTFFVNGVKVPGATYEHLDKVVKHMLK